MILIVRLHLLASHYIHERDNDNMGHVLRWWACACP